MKHDTTKTTTVRLPAELHRRLMVTVAELGVTAQSLICDAIKRELHNRGFGRERAIGIPATLTPLLAELFLQSMPTFALIKDRQRRIVWVNFFFERELNARLIDVVGMTIGETGLVRPGDPDAVDAHIRQTLRDQTATMHLEAVELPGRGSVLVRAVRCTIDPEHTGDISFVSADVQERSFAVDADVIVRMERTIPETVAAKLFIPFLEAAPVAIAIKRPLANDSEIVWANAEFARVAGARNSAEVIRTTTRTLFALPPEHEILENERYVLTTKQARMALETRGSHERWSLRFPILDAAGAVALIGVVSPNFRQSDAREAR